MLKKIEPKQDAYGNLVRGSFFADYVELLAIKGHRNRRKLLRDLIVDVYGSSREILTDPLGSDPGAEWDPGDTADVAWSCLEQRSAVLGDLYPFNVGSNSLTLKTGFRLLESPYIGLLAVSIAHAFAAAPALRVEQTFEVLVGDALEHLGLDVGRLGEISRSGGYDFESTMRELGTELGIPTYPNAIVRRVNANDSGVDVVAHLNWSDGRSGRWLYIGQVTCARSDDWLRKLHEPVPEDWMEYMGEVVTPVPFLALPYHVEDAAIQHYKGHRRSIVDRPQLAMNIPRISPELQSIIEAVLNAEMQTFAVQ